MVSTKWNMLNVCVHVRVRVIYVQMNWKHQKRLMQLTSNIISPHTHTLTLVLTLTTGIYLICAVCVHINKNHTTYTIIIHFHFIQCMQWYLCQNCVETTKWRMKLVWPKTVYVPYLKSFNMNMKTNHQLRDFVPMILLWIVVDFGPLLIYHIFHMYLKSCTTCIYW